MVKPTVGQARWPRSWGQTWQIRHSKADLWEALIGRKMRRPVMVDMTRAPVKCQATHQKSLHFGAGLTNQFTLARSSCDWYCICIWCAFFVIFMNYSVTLILLGFCWGCDDLAYPYDRKTWSSIDHPWSFNDWLISVNFELSEILGEYIDMAGRRNPG